MHFQTVSLLFRYLREIRDVLRDIKTILEKPNNGLAEEIRKHYDAEIDRRMNSVMPAFTPKPVECPKCRNDWFPGK